jgi:Ca2+-binding RTX toxin-like protein
LEKETGIYGQIAGVFSFVGATYDGQDLVGITLGFGVQTSLGVAGYTQYGVTLSLDESVTDPFPGVDISLSGNLGLGVATPVGVPGLPVGAYRGQIKDDVTVTIGVGITDLVEAGIYSTFPGDGLPGSLASRGIDYSPQFSGYSGGHPGIDGVYGGPSDSAGQFSDYSGGHPGIDGVYGGATDDDRNNGFGESNAVNTARDDSGQFSDYSGGHPGIDGTYSDPSDSAGQFSNYSGGHPGIDGVYSEPANDSMQSGSSTSGYSDSDSGGGAGKPILIDLDGDGVELAPRDMNFTLFDFDDDGFAERTAWVGADDGLLMFDENSDGQITKAREIAFAKWLERDGVTDLEALAEIFDSNRDGVLNQFDDDWEGFGVWQDSNSDGVLDEGELRSLASLGITAIGLTYSSDTALVLSDGSAIAGFIEVTRISADGGTETLLGADAALAHDDQGVRITTDVNGVTTYEFEAGEIEHGLAIAADAVDTENHIHLGVDGDADSGAASEDPVQGGVMLAGLDLRSILGNDQANRIDGSGRSVDLVLAGANGDDEIYGGAGADFLDGGAGDDLLAGNDGNDILFGGAGADKLFGGAGDDMLFADAEDFAGGEVSGGEGFDALFITDQLSADGTQPAGVDITLADHDIEYVQGGAGDDTVRAYQLAENVFIDPITGELYELKEDVEGSFRYVRSITSVTEQVYASNGEGYSLGYRTTKRTAWGTKEYISDELRQIVDENGEVSIFDWLIVDTDLAAEGEETADVEFYSFRMLGGSGNDSLSGALGDDLLAGEAGDDRLQGDYGNDTYFFGVGDGNDVIHDVSAAPMITETEHELSYSISTSYPRIVHHGENEYEVMARDIDYRSRTYTTLDISAGTDFGGVDTIRFGPGIRFENLAFENVIGADGETDNLLITVSGVDAEGAATVDTLTIENFHDPDAAVELLAFTNGVTFDFRHVMEGLGTAAADTLNGGVFDFDGDSETEPVERNDVLQGFVGDDMLVGGGGADFLFGGAGNDRMEGGSDGDIYYYRPGDGDDVISDIALDGESNVTDGGVDVISFGAGILFDNMAFERSGENGDDLLIRISLTDGDGTSGQSGSILIEGYFLAGSRIEWLVFDDGSALHAASVIGHALASDQPDLVVWTQSSIHIDGGLGDDSIVTGEFDDTLYGGSGDDTLDGGSGDDTYVYRKGDGNDFIKYHYFNSGVDQLILMDIHPEEITVRQSDDDIVLEITETGVGVTLERQMSTNYNAVDKVVFADGTQWGAATLAANARYLGTEGNDVLFVPGSTASKIYGLAGNDIILGGRYNDILDGGEGDDSLSGENGDDVLNGGAGVDILFGGIGSDTLNGGEGDDTLFGGEGDDVLNGGAGDDILFGGTGADTFVFTDLSSGMDVIDDFEDGIDRLDFDGRFAFDDLAIEQIGEDTLLTIDDPEFGMASITLTGFNATQFSADDLVA